MTRNMDIFLLIFQPSEFLSIYTIVITGLLTYSRPRFFVLSQKSCQSLTPQTLGQMERISGMIERSVSAVLIIVKKQELAGESKKEQYETNQK